MNKIEKTLILRLAQGIGNQLFMYANAYSLSKSYNYKLLIDNTSGYFKKKNHNRSYELNNFLIDEHIASPDIKFDTYSKDLKRKILIKLDLFRTNKSFILEKKDSSKKTFFSKINLDNYSNKSFLESNCISQLRIFKKESYYELKFNETLEGRILTIDSLRGVAIVMVLMLHTIQYCVYQISQEKIIGVRND